MQVLAFSGSLRERSYNTALARAAADHAPPGVHVELYDGLAELPPYDEDLDGEDAPASVRELRERIAQADGLLFVTPEYNRSLPGALKNAIDVGSRPYGKAAWTGKPCAVVSQSPGALGGFGANHAVRQCLVFLNMPCMQMPEAYIGGIAGKFDGDQLKDESLRGFLQQFMECYATWVERHAD